MNANAQDGRSAGPAPEAVPAEKPTVAVGPSRRAVLAGQKQRFGGITWGSAFFGWLTATGTAVLLTVLVGVVAALTVSDAATGSASDAAVAGGRAWGSGLVGAIVVAAIVLVAYYCGGYVAGRMARFHGLRQGLAVWLWGLLVAVVAGILVAVAGSRFGGLADLNALPNVPVGGVTFGTIVAAVLVLAVALVGALFGGLAGMRFHRRVDRVGTEVL